MATPPPPPESQPPLPKRQSGIKTVLRYTGIPPSWLDKRPKLPSRNWLIFLSCTSSIIGLYVYDRRQCKQIRQSYVDKVKHLSEVPVDPFETPRRVTVLAAKWPADEDYDQSLRYFRKYVKPILVAAAVDYNYVPGKRHGDIARWVAEDIRQRRRLDSGLDDDPEPTKALPTYKPVAQRRKTELETGGIVIVGRPTFKEFMVGLKQGWTAGLDKVDADEQLAHLLDEDNVFDEPEDPRFVNYDNNEENESGAAASQSQSPMQLAKQNSPVFSPLQMRPSSSSITSSQSTPSNSTSSIQSAIPATVTPLPPLLLVPFTNYIGIKQIPLMIWGFFNQRHKVRAGSEAGYRLVMNATRPIEVPDVFEDDLAIPADGASKDEDKPAPNLGDLDFNKDAEGYYKKSLASLEEDIEGIRKKYYDALPAKLNTARELARGTREPTKAEYENPPPTEVELRAERLKKEKRWRNDVEGWQMIKPSEKVAWDSRFKDALRVFVDPPQDDSSEPTTS